MRRVIVSACILTISGLVMAQQPDPVPDLQKRILELTNEFRKAEKKQPLKSNAKLTAAAQKHAENMARQEKSNHVLDGKSHTDRMKQEKYAAREAGENVGAVSRDMGDKMPAIMLEAWKDSAGHRDNMLKEVFTEIGIGAAVSKSGKWYFCQVFGKPAK